MTPGLLPSAESRHVAADHKEKYTNAQLPAGCQDNSAWCRLFIPTCLQYLASRDSDNVWAINNDEAVSMQQNIWNFVYRKKIPHIITVQGPVFALIGILILLPISILISPLSRLINVFVNGTADLLLPPCLLSMPSSMTMSLILNTAIKNLQSLLWNHGRFSTMILPLPRMVR